MNLSFTTKNGFQYGIRVLVENVSSEMNMISDEEDLALRISQARRLEVG